MPAVRGQERAISFPEQLSLVYGTLAKLRRWYHRIGNHWPVKLTKKGLRTKRLVAHGLNSGFGIISPERWCVAGVLSTTMSMTYAMVKVLHTSDYTGST